MPPRVPPRAPPPPPSTPLPLPQPPAGSPPKALQRATSKPPPPARLPPPLDASTPPPLPYRRRSPTAGRRPPRRRHPRRRRPLGSPHGSWPQKRAHCKRATTGHGGRRAGTRARARTVVRPGRRKGAGATQTRVRWPWWRNAQGGHARRERVGAHHQARAAPQKRPNGMAGASITLPPISGAAKQPPSTGSGQPKGADAGRAVSGRQKNKQRRPQRGGTHTAGGDHASVCEPQNRAHGRGVVSAGGSHHPRH